MKILSPVDMAGNTLAGLPAPTADTHAATKLYVDTMGGGAGIGTGWAVTPGYVPDKTFNPEATTVTEVARVLGTLIDASPRGGVSADHSQLTNRTIAGQHPASAISFTPVGTVAATDVQAAIAEVASEAGGGGPLGLRISKVLTADQPVTHPGSGYSDIPTLSWTTTVTAGRAYRIEAHLVISTSATSGAWPFWARGGAAGDLYMNWLFLSTGPTTMPVVEGTALYKPSVTGSVTFKMSFSGPSVTHTFSSSYPCAFWIEDIGPAA